MISNLATDHAQVLLVSFEESRKGVYRDTMKDPFYIYMIVQSEPSFIYFFLWNLRWMFLLFDFKIQNIWTFFVVYKQQQRILQNGLLKEQSLCMYIIFINYILKSNIFL